ncbi:hypothetical protein BJ684DRAFT_18358 [Piptocephalis cylindrospora]|uniref:leucine--tRNA ligase n=1 Tax=Piptocephalis cylindrospora TaxID=1907219 RepID=A0A4P9Y8F6_9FUNG|nr:hypothetical protein BJ684DRAFT_18358 [Piptocephalis cylindrospora]|eukprot:RKP15315.1 hypothetical protein BJ684DRAFT_18358 [Piptocephalis cylindrospora]
MSAITDEPKKTQKRDTLRSLEQPAQELWKKLKSFEHDAPTEEECADESQLHLAYPKYMATFPFPYMNGRLHLGHTFTFSKVEFATGYERLKGRRALFPFGLHCTGMPIKTSADKIAREVEQFGEDFSLADTTAGVSDMDLSGGAVKKPGKVAAKDTGAKYQFEIMRSVGVPEAELAKFADPHHWLTYFPALAFEDTQLLGCKIDYRRSFYTTDANLFYDAFVRWQMNKLHALGKIKFGERYTIYSPKDDQPCMDHDRKSGEGIGPQEYTVIRMAVDTWAPAAVEAMKEANFDLGSRSVYLVAATLRPETMYGQTNCYVGPDLAYGLYEVSETEVYVCTERSARNMCFQGQSRTKGVHVALGPTLTGRQLVGTRVKAPLSHYDTVYVLPMETVLATKGTGVVTSVPSDSPDDFATWADLVKKPAYYGIEEAWVAPFEPVPIVRTPTYGDLCAPTVCAAKKVASPKDRVQLVEAKDICYKEGFYNGTLLVGKYAGEAVQTAKAKVRDDLIAAGLAFPYAEPEGLVMSRSDDECVVNLCDQWYLDYGEKVWRAQVERLLVHMNTYGEEARHQFEKTLAWLNQWACARSFGLGTRLPWDPQFLVESLSDSTIYMAYYTVAHMLHPDCLDGSKPGPFGITPAQMTDAVWEYLFGCGASANPADYPELQASFASEKVDPIPDAVLRKMRREFHYWYPLDLRVSGKDLIPNHLTFFLYNHAALFPESMFPRAVRSNGHLMLNGAKMAKSTGNFLTLEQSVELYGADATRVALADAGDGMEDANFEASTANAAILRLHTLKEWAEEVMRTHETAKPVAPGSPAEFWGRVFLAEMAKCVQEAERAYDGMMYRDALKAGLYELQGARDRYRDAVGGDAEMDIALARQYLEVQTILITPFAPHLAEYLWVQVLGHTEGDGTVMSARWPTVAVPEDSVEVLAAAEFIRDLTRRVREAEATALKRKKSTNFDPSKPKALTLYVAKTYPAWQDGAIGVVKALYEEAGSLEDGKALKAALAKGGWMKDKRVMPFVQEVKKRVASLGADAAFARTLMFDETKTLELLGSGVQRVLGYDTLSIRSKEDVLGQEGADDAEKRRADLAVPAEPSIFFENIVSQ